MGWSESLAEAPGCNNANELKIGVGSSRKIVEDFNDDDEDEDDDDDDDRLGEGAVDEVVAVWSRGIPLYPGGKSEREDSI